MKIIILICFQSSSYIKSNILHVTNIAESNIYCEKMVILCNCPFTIVVDAKGISFPYAFEEFFNMIYKQSKLTSIKKVVNLTFQLDT